MLLTPLVRGFVAASAPARPVAVFRIAVGLAAVIKTVDFAAQLLMKDEVRFADRKWLGEHYLHCGRWSCSSGSLLQPLSWSDVEAASLLVLLPVSASSLFLALISTAITSIS